MSWSRRVSGAARAPAWPLWLAALLALALLSPAAGTPAARAQAGGAGARLDTTVADFDACPPAADLVVANEAGGELRRAAALEEYFDAPLDGAGWAWGTWNGTAYGPAPAGGTLTVAAPGGSAWLRSTQPFTRRTLSARATLGAGPWQHVGWAREGFGDRWAIVSTAEGGGTLYARTFDGNIELRTALAGVAVGSAHDVRIVWDAAQVEYYVDGAAVALHSLSLGDPMYAYASNNGAAPLGLDALRVESYQPGASAYLSCPRDVGAADGWGSLSWQAAVPAGTGLALETRSSVDGQAWSGWSAVVASGSPIGSPAGRYLQYRATLTSSATASPRLDEVAFTTTADTPTPTRTPTSLASATPTATASATPSATVTATTTTTTTPRPITTARIDTTIGDFAAGGVPAGLVVANEAGGELRRAAALEEYFDAPLDAAGWQRGTWNGKFYSPAPTGGALAVQAPNGSAWLRSTEPLAAGTLAGRVSFGAGPWEHVGFAGAGFGDRWAILSTAASGDRLWARTFDGSSELWTALPGVSLDAYHDVRIAWLPGRVDYQVDGALVASHPLALAGPMYVYGSNNDLAGTLWLDFLRVDAYPAGAAEYVSTVKDAGAAGGWGSLSWQAAVPAGTGLALETRSSVDGQAWSGWSAVAASGSPIGSPAGRYLQYRATLTSALDGSPRLEQVAYTTGDGSTGPSTPTATATPTSTATRTPTATATSSPTATPGGSGAQADTWAVTAPPSAPRVDPSTTLLPGGKVLVAGGCCSSPTSGLTVATSELYDPATGRWSPTGSMAQTRRWHSATLLPSGKVLVAGGCCGGSAYWLASAELYDPATGLWSPTGAMLAEHSGHTGTLLPSGKVLVAGGESTAAAELYDPATGLWSPTGSMSIQRTNHTATLLPNGKVLVVGACCAADGGGIASAELYDPATGAWSPTGRPAVGRTFHTATSLSNGQVLVTGGWGPGLIPSAAAELYDPATGLWSPTAPLTVARDNHTATLLPSGKVLVDGGSALASAELYDPATGTWSPTPAMSRPRERPFAARLASGAVLVAGEDFRTTSAELWVGPAATADATRTDTTLADFGACGLESGLLGVVDEAGGELRLPALLEDYFTAPLAKTRWSWGSWDGSAYSPAPAGGALTLQSAGGPAWLRSTGGFTRRTLEGRVTFGAAWQQVGWADATFAGRFALLSTYDGSGLYARTSDGAGEQRTLLAVPASGVHDVRIVWGDAAVDYYVDGARVASHTAVPSVPLYAWASSNSTAAPLTLQWLRAAAYAPASVTHVSCVEDARAFGAAGLWRRLSWVARVPTGTTLSLETRTSPDGQTWSPWTAATSGAAIASPPARYLQYRATLTSSATDSPRLDEVAVTTVG